MKAYLLKSPQICLADLRIKEELKILTAERTSSSFEGTQRWSRDQVSVYVYLLAPDHINVSNLDNTTTV